MKETNNDRETEKNTRLRTILGGAGKAKKIFYTIEAAYSAASQGAAGTIGENSWSREKLITALENAAKEKEVWIDDTSGLKGEEVGEGGENKVYQNPSEPSTVIKFNRMTYSADSKAGFDALLDGLIAQGELFPALEYEVLGFAHDVYGNVAIILRQQYVTAERYATEEEINAWFQNNKFTKERFGFWSNGKYKIHDYKPANVMVANNGILAFIDPIIVSYTQQ
ncbi:MAG: hypothetical protein IPM04_05415 [Saprospiraceae bacterium]|nr:hypothetical protein [Candidatus Brachybacter algidus]MBK8747305.1 hypothetical protein [Candidatus Brachybacter algidus]